MTKQTDEERQETKIARKLEYLHKRQKGWMRRMRRGTTELRKIAKSIQYYETKRAVLVAVAKAKGDPIKTAGRSIDIE